MARELLQLRGVAVFPWLTPGKPDTKFDPDGLYRVNVRMSAEDAAPIIARLEQIIDSQAADAQKKVKGRIKRADAPWKDVLDDDGSPTGYILFACKSKASGVDKKTGERWSRTIPMFDKRAKQLPAGSEGIGTGSLIVASVEPQGFYTPALGAGVTLRLKGVQVLNHVPYGASAEALGFSAEEYEGDEAGSWSHDPEDPGPAAPPDGDYDNL